MTRNVDPHVRNAFGLSAPAWLRWLLLFALLAGGGGHAISAGVDLAGEWAQLEVLSDSATFPLVGQLSRTTTLVRLLTIEQTGTKLALSGTYCSAMFDNGSALTTTIDPVFVRSLVPALATAALDDAASPFGFLQAWSTEIHGARLDDPETDPLPTSALDPRVYDQDGDGKPGITVHACALGVITGDVYVIQRLRTRLVGEVVSSARVEGMVEGTVEQVILGATNALFLGSIVSHPDPVAERSFFVLERIDPSWTCQEVLLRQATLFRR